MSALNKVLVVSIVLKEFCLTGYSLCIGIINEHNVLYVLLRLV